MNSLHMATYLCLDVSVQPCIFVLQLTVSYGDYILLHKYVFPVQLNSFALFFSIWRGSSTVNSNLYSNKVQSRTSVFHSIWRLCSLTSAHSSSSSLTYANGKYPTLLVVLCSPFHQPLSLPVLLRTATRSPDFRLICDVAVAA